MSFGSVNSTSTNPLTDNPYADLVEQLVELESKRKYELENNITQQKSLKSAVSGVGSKLTALDSFLRDIEILEGTNFNVFSTKSSSESITVSNSDQLKAAGNYSIDVHQLAKSDIRIGKRFNDAEASTISQAVTDSELNRTFSITLPNAGEDGEAKTFEISIDSVEGKTDKQILQEVANQINDIAGEHVDATLISEDGSSARLRIRSNVTGKDGLITFSHEPNPGETNIAELLDFTTSEGTDNTTVSTGATSAGGRMYDAEQLNAKFSFDGLEFERTSNSITDVVDGLNMDLVKVTDKTETITVSSDLDGTKAIVNEFMGMYNSLVKDIRTKSQVNPEADTRGVLANNRSFLNLTYDLRNTLINDVEGGSELNNLLELGIDFKEDGTMYIEDEEKLNEALTNSLSDVKNLFANKEDGLAVRMRSSFETYIKGDNSIIKTVERSVDSRVSSYKNRLEVENSFLNKRRDILNQQYLQLQELATQADSQYATIMAMMGR